MTRAKLMLEEKGAVLYLIDFLLRCSYARKNFG